jgi:DNA primase
VTLSTGVWNCFGCGSKGSIFDFYMKRNRVDFPTAKYALAEKAGLSLETKKKIVKTYDYKDEAGNLLFQVVRYEPKDFRQRRPDGKMPL